MRKPLSVSATVFLVVLLVAFDASAGRHRSAGQVVRIDPAERTVVLRENGHELPLIVRRTTVLFGDQGQSLHGLKALQVGDYVREECDSRVGGPYIARRISVLFPAWRLLESPER